MAARIVGFALSIAIALLCCARPVRGDESDDQYAVAAGHYSAQRWDLAVGEFRELIKDHPGNPNSVKALFFLGEALVQLGKYDEAHAEFDRFIAADSHSPFAPQAMFRAGETALLAGRRTVAREAFNDFRDKYPNDKLNAFVLMYLGQIALADNDAAAAQAAFDEALKRFPDAAPGDEIRLGLARTAELKGDRAAAEKQYRELAAGQNASIAEQAELRLALLRLQAEQWDQAAEALAAFERQHPKSSAAPEARLGRAKALYQLKQLDQARDLLEGLRGDAEFGDEAQYWLGLVDEAKGDWAGAIKAFTKLLDADPQQPLAPRIRYQLADAQYHGGDFAAAIKTLEEAEPSGGEAAKRTRAASDSQLNANRYLLAICYQAAGRDAEALAQFDRISRGATGELAIKIKWARPASLIATGKFAAAAELLEADLKSLPAGEFNDRALAQLAVCQTQLGENDKAAVTFDRLLERSPDGPAAAEACWSRGQVLERLKKFDAALASYQLIVEKFATSNRYDDALLAAARLQNQLHQNAPAIELYERFLRERPNSQQTDAALYGLGWALRDVGKRTDADAEFLKLHDTFATSRFWNDATFRLAESALQAKQADHAAHLLDELIAAKPPAEIMQHAIYLQGQVAVAEEKWDRVAKTMQRLAQDYPDSTLRLPAEYWVAEAAYRQGNFDDAGKRFTALSDQIAGRTDKWLAMVPLRRAQVLAQQKQWGDAQTLAARIAVDYPDFSEQYEVDYLLGRALAAQADFDAARKCYLRVVRSSTGGKTETAAMAQWMIGESYFHQENYEAALREYLRVEILYPYPRWQAAALLQAGKCQEALGHWKDATELYARLIKVYSNTEFTEEATRRLHDAEGHQTADADRPLK